MGLVLTQGLAHLKWTWFDNARPLQDLETYDIAAHGPLGAAMLLLTVRNRHIITAIGAIVTIAALGIDPMVQGLVKYYDCSWPVSGLNATIPHAQIFSEAGKDAGLGLIQLPLAQQAAISSGLYTPGQLAMTFDCPSGNCTFSRSYSSIAYCANCADISDRVVVRNHTERVYSYDGSTYPSTGLNYTETKYTTATLPSGLSNSNNFYNTYFTMGSPSVDGRVDVLVGAPSTNLFSPPVSGCKSPEAAKSWACRGYGAVSCSLLPCIQTYSGHIAGGKLIEKRIANWTKWVNSGEYSPYNSMIDMTCATSTEKNELAKLGYQFDDSTLFLAYKQSFNESTGDWEPQSYDNGKFMISKYASVIPRKGIFELNEITTIAINAYWPTLFNSSLSLSVGGFDVTAISMVDLFWNDGFASFDHIASYFENITQALTTHIRQLEDSPFAPATEGVVLRNITCVRVRWEFLIFPAVIIVMMLVFFVGMALETRNRSGVEGIDHGFKSTPLALIVHGLDSDVQNKLATPVESMRGKRNVVVVGSGRNEAKKVVVRLSPTEHGLRFVTE